MEQTLEASERQHDWEEVLAPKVSVISDNKPIRKIICRYGRGCTHIYDPVHKDRFWHPPCPILNVEQIRSHYICNECGFGFTVLNDLQRHLQRKTAWSNNSLIGSRVSCLVDSKEWHEGIVTQFHPKSGKHYVEFRAIGEKRWFNMLKVAFYIIERPQEQNASEVKEMDAGDQEYPPQNPLSEENWAFVDDISLDYSFAQSVLFKMYGSVIQETGHKTRGHVCLTADDRDNVKNTKGSLLYGELLPRGANRAFDSQHLHCATASVLFDLGCGTGKIAVQAFLQYRNLEYVYGVEISAGRYSVAEEAIIHMVELLGEDDFIVEVRRGQSIVIKERNLEDSSRCRMLKIECGNMMDVTDISRADIVMLETDIPQELQSQLCALLHNMPEGSRTLTYLDMRKIWDQGAFPFKQHESNRSLTDRFPTSWSVQRGHHFYIWNKISRLSSGNTIRNAGGNWSSSMANRSQSQGQGQDAVEEEQQSVRSRPHGVVAEGDHGGCLPFFLPSSSWKRGLNSTTEEFQERHKNVSGSAANVAPCPYPSRGGPRSVSQSQNHSQNGLNNDSGRRRNVNMDVSPSTSTCNPVPVPVPTIMASSPQMTRESSSYRGREETGGGSPGGSYSTSIHTVGGTQIARGTVTVNRTPRSSSNHSASGGSVGGLGHGGGGGGGSTGGVSTILGYGNQDDTAPSGIIHSNSTSPPSTSQGRRSSPRTVLVSPKSPEADACTGSPEREWGRERQRQTRMKRQQSNSSPADKLVLRNEQKSGNLPKQSKENGSPESGSAGESSKSSCIIS